MFDATTILAYKGKNKAVIGGDGQVTFGDSVLKGNATKIRTLHNGKILAGFAGSTADAFNLFDMFEEFLDEKKGDEPEDGEIASIGSGGNYAISAARALKKHTEMDEEELVKESLNIAGDLCIYTNHNIKTLTLEEGK